MQAKLNSIRLLLPCDPYLPGDKIWTGVPWMLLSKVLLQNDLVSLCDHEAEFKVGSNSETVKWSLTFQKVAITR